MPEPFFCPGKKNLIYVIYTLYTLYTRYMSVFLLTRVKKHNRVKRNTL